MNKQRQLAMKIFDECVRVAGKQSKYDSKVKIFDECVRVAGKQSKYESKVTKTPIGGLGIPNDLCIFGRFFETRTCLTYYVSFNIMKIGGIQEQLEKL